MVWKWLSSADPTGSLGAYLSSWVHEKFLSQEMLVTYAIPAFIMKELS